MWARAHSTLPAFLVVEQQQSPHTAHSEALSKSVWMHLLLCKHSTAHQESPPKESGEQGGCCVKLHFPDKKKKNHSWESNLAFLPLWASLTAGKLSGVKTQSTKVCTAPLLEADCLDSCCSKCSSQKKAALHSAVGGATSGCEHSWTDVAELVHTYLWGISEPGACREVTVGGQVCPGCATSALSPARVRSPALPEGGCVVFRVSLKFLPLLPHEEFVSLFNDREGQAGSFLCRCFGRGVSGTAFPCKYLHN